jgi:nitrite reductase (NO-forming)
MSSETPKIKDYTSLADIIAGAVRAAFGLVWAFDAYLKWQPVFLNNYLSYITGVIDGQPVWLQPWFHFWVAVISPNPSLFAWLTRIIETIIAVGLLLGLGRKWVYLLGGVFSLLIWSIPEGFGGPYSPGATDVGAGLIYFLLFIVLIILDYALGRSPYSLDYYIERTAKGWRRFAEWANPGSVIQEPQRLSWLIQTITLLGLVIILVVFLIILSGELKNNAALPASFIIQHGMAFLGR